MNSNRYYLPLLSDPNINEIIEISVGTLKQQREDLAEEKIVIKLYQDDHEQHEVLKPYEEYNQMQACEIMCTPEWRREQTEEP